MKGVKKQGFTKDFETFIYGGKVYIKVSKSRDKTAIQRMDALSRRNVKDF